MAAARIGISIDQYEEMTPYQLNIYIQAYQENKKEDIEDRITLAYKQAYWTIQWLGKQKPESLDKILGKKPKEQSPEDMLKEIMKLNAELGGDTE